MRKKDVNMKRKLDNGKTVKRNGSQKKKRIGKKRENYFKQREIEHKHPASKIDKLAPHNIYTSNKGQSDKTQTHNPAPPKLSTYDGTTERRPCLIQFDHIAKNTTGQMQKSWTN